MLEKVFNGTKSSGMRVIHLWHCMDVMETQIALIAAFRSSTLSALVSVIFLFSTHHEFCFIGFIIFFGKKSSVKLMVIEPAAGYFCSLDSCPFLVEIKIRISLQLHSGRQQFVPRISWQKVAQTLDLRKKRWTNTSR